MDSPIEHLMFRGVLESRGQLTVEAELVCASGVVGRGSAPVAIAPGRREQPRSRIGRLGRLDDCTDFLEFRAAIESRRFDSQEDFDRSILGPCGSALGADVTLAASIAFARASAAERGVSLVQGIAELAESRPRVPRPLVNVFSGGIHDRSGHVPFQQIMFAPDAGSFPANVASAIAVYAAAESWARGSGASVRYSASGGMVIEDAGHAELFEGLNVVLADLGFSPPQGWVAADLAAEHLREADGRYRFGAAKLRGEQLLQELASIADRFNVELLEDPFDAVDLPLWRELSSRVAPPRLIAGDDIFSTNPGHIEPEIATAIVLKPNQIGTVTGTIGASRVARGAGLALCVSHRSGETEDPFMCDLAVGLGAAFIKVGGPRGDRIPKYNQLLRLSEGV